MKYQYLAALSANLLSLMYGISVGWAAPNILLFQSDQSPIGKLSMEEISPIASLLCIGGIVGTFFFGWWTDKFGRKSILLALVVPELFSLALLLFGKHYFYIYASRILGGFVGGGIFVIIPIFVTEISDVKIRGALGSLLIMFINLGILIGYILSSLLPYNVNTYVNLGILGLFLSIFFMFPESPEFLVLKNKDEIAEKSFKFYNGVSKDDPLPLTLQRTFEDMKDFVGKETKTKKSKFELIKEFKDKSVYLGLIYSLIFIAFADLSGALVILNYLTFIFKKTFIEIDIYLCTIIVGFIQMIGSGLSLVLVDKFGRRILFMVSAIGTGVLIAICGVYFYLLEIPAMSEICHKLQWIPLLTLCGFILLCNVGIASLPFIIISELLPVHLRGIASTIALALSWALAFTLIQTFPFFISLVGIYGAMAFFTFCCFLDLLLVYFLLPETKGISYQEIQLKLNKNKL